MKYRIRNANKVRDRILATGPPGVANSIRMNMFGPNWDGANEEQKVARRAFNFRGEGDYKDWINSWLPRGTFEKLGRSLGAWTGIPGIDNLGAWGGSKLSDYAGFGDYSANQIVAGGSGSQQTISVNRSDATGDIYVTRTEFVGNLTATNGGAGSSGFAISSFPLNPGLSRTFPFLSQIASNFTLYEFEGLMFQYKPLFSEDAGSSNNLGKVIFATQYDPSAPAFVNSVQMENYDYANATKPSCGLVHGVETANRQQFGNLQYVRTGITSRDLIFTDIGTLWVATEGIPFSAAATQVIGEIWVTYRVKLSRAEVNNSLLGFNIPQDFFTGTSSAAATVVSVSPRSTNAIGCTVSNVSNISLRITFPLSVSVGSFLVIVSYTSGTTVFTTQGANVGNPFNNAINCTGSYPSLQSPSTSGGANPASPINAVGTTSQSRICHPLVVNVNAPGAAQASIDINNTGSLTATTTFQVFITQINSNVSF